MAGTVYKSKAEIPTIDVALVTIEVDGREFGFDTASEVEVEPQFNEIDPVQLIIKGKLKAQKRGSSILTGNQITMTDNVFNPELVQVLQGGTIQYWSDAGRTPRLSLALLATLRRLLLLVTRARHSSATSTLHSTMRPV